MKARIFLWIGVTVAAVAIWFLLHESHANARRQTATTATAKVGNSTNMLSIGGPPGNRPAVKTNQSHEDIEHMFLEGRISRKEAILEAVREKNRQSQDFYGKVINQYGEPVPDASVTGTTEMITGLGDDSTPRTYKTESDAEGLFQFTGIWGWQFNVSIEKNGYVLNPRGRGYNGPVGGKTSPDNRGVFTMWKLRGPEPLATLSIDAKIPFDGNPATFDMKTGKASPDGDLRITLSRFPLEVRRSGQGFDWTVKIELLQGGLIAENDSYPYWAPEDGYEPFFAFSVSSNDIPWQSTFTQNFYIRDSQGQYGRMQANVYTALTPARIQFNLAINPSGSQNLEPSSAN